MLRPETFRKIIILIGMCLCAFMEGVIFGHSVSMVASLFDEKEEMQISDETISWIISVIYAPMILGGISATVFTERFGRRLTLTAFNIPAALYWLILHYANDGTTLILCRLLAGFCFGGMMPTIYMTMTEYSSPNKRGSNFAIVAAMYPVAAVLGQFFTVLLHWRIAALVALVPAMFAAILPLFYVESPQWLASRGRFKECETNFRLLHGYDSEKELELLLEVEKCKFVKMKTEKTQIILALIKRLTYAAKKKYFWKLIFLAYIIQLYKIVCGIVLKGCIGITILQHVTGQSDVLKFTILCDGFLLFGSVLSNFLLNNVKSRTLLFAGGLLNNIILIIFCIVIYMDLNGDILLAWFKTLLLALHYFVLASSAYPMLELLPQEMFPLDIKTISTNIISLFGTMTMFVYTKMIPSLFVHLDYYGMYMLSVLIMFLCLLLFWFKLPETKGRTLQEIELYFKNDRFLNMDEILKGEEIKGLV